MRANANLRVLVLSVACFSISVLAANSVFAQDVGADVGGGAGIFRAKNPETKKSKAPATSGKPANRPAANRPKGPAVEERVEDLLEKGNSFRDARKYSEAEAAYQGILKIKPKDSRAAYGLGNVYSDQQKWDEAETSYRNATLWSPNNADAYLALSVVLVQPKPGGDNAKRFADAELAARR